MEEYRVFVIMIAVTFAIYGTFRVIVDVLYSIAYALSIPYMSQEDKVDAIDDDIHLEDYCMAAAAWFIVGCLALGG